MARSKFDPLESAKVTAERRAKDDETADIGPPQQGWASNQQPPPPAFATPAKEPDPATEAASAASLPDVTPTKRTMFEVVVPKMVSVGGGQMHHFKAGYVIDPSGYGGVDAVRRMGLELREVEVEV